MFLYNFLISPTTHIAVHCYIALVEVRAYHPALTATLTAFVALHAPLNMPLRCVAFRL
jgi:hypothetical protein